MGFFYKLKPVTDNINKKENAVKGFTAMAVSIACACKSGDLLLAVS